MPRTEPTAAAAARSRLSFVIDLTSYADDPETAHLVIRCRTCRELFECDHEEADCSSCRAPAHG